MDFTLVSVIFYLRNIFMVILFNFMIIMELLNLLPDYFSFW
ncbi:hypothetical protein BN439_1111 [Erwinia amylovora Ea644]|nr:hypothetical protein BN439_1111 [Erwinia amylovora Ea644]